MGVYIPSMEMPKTDALLHVHADGRAVFYPFSADGEVTEFQAVPVPPHGRLIDADALTKHIKRDGIASDPFVKIVCDYFKDAPTIIPAEEGET